VRFAVGIEYAGSAYAGWQRQSAARSVQAEVERALSRVADAPIEVTCAGRTDAGVHALGQVAHFDSDAVRAPRGWLLGANGHLPADVALTFVQAVADDFHARYAALARTYRYLIVNRPTRSPLFDGRALWRHQPLDADAMHAALQPLIGEHDFSAFRAAECQSRSPVRRLERIAVTRSGALLTVEVTANAFLHHMVRNIVGSALEVGEGERPVGWIGDLLACGDRRLAGPTAPPGGLYLARVDYPLRHGLPVPASSGLSAMIRA
jgi:tRNA pseudouridine38-40 synthase